MSLQLRCAAIPLAALFAACGVAHADDGEPHDAAVAVAGEPALRVERVDTPNLAIPTPPGLRADLTEIGVQRWLERGRAGIGVGVGSLSLVNRPTGLITGQAIDGAAVTTGTTLMLGLRYRATDRSSFYANASHVRGLGIDGQDGIVSKVGMEFKAAQSNWKIAYGGFGFRLAGDARMTVKLRRSGVTVMMKRAF